MQESIDVTSPENKKEYILDSFGTISQNGEPLTAGAGSMTMVDDDDEIMRAQVRGPVYENGSQEAVEIAIKQSPGTNLINKTLIKVQLN